MTAVRVFLTVLVLALAAAASACHVSVGPGGIEVDDAPHIPIRDLGPGECMESFSALDAYARGTGVDAVVVPCEEPHELEVSAVFEVSDAPEAYPGEGAMEQRAGVMCLEAFGEYTGIDAWDTNLISGQVYPLAASWEQGDRQITCLIHHRDRTVLNGSVRGAGDTLFVDLGERRGWQSVTAGECLNNVALFGFTGKLSVTECAKLHEAEVHYVAEITVFGDDYPGDEALRSHVRQECAARVADYIGGPIEEAELDTFRFGPDEVGWSNGDRKMICLLTHAAPGTRFTGSVAANP